MESWFQQKMCLVYHAQICLLLRTGEIGNLSLLFYTITIFWESYHKIDTTKCSSDLGVEYPGGFQGPYTGLGTQLCIQLMKNS